MVYLDSYKKKKKETDKMARQMGHGGKTLIKNKQNIYQGKVPTRNFQCFSVPEFSINPGHLAKSIRCHRSSKEAFTCV